MTTICKPIDADRVRAVLSYCPETGQFTWRRDPFRSVQWNGRFAGKHAGTKTLRGYTTICIDYVRYAAHRLAFVWMTGDCPEVVDHINQNGEDNRWENLRPADRSKNGINRGLSKSNTSGVCGVSWFKPAKLWQAEITRRRHKFHLGYFKSFDAAVVARREAERTLPDAEYNPANAKRALQPIRRQ